MKDNRSYYDDFAGWYERERHHGYHALLDDLQIDLATPLSAGRDILEIGCGTGLLLKELDPIASHAVGIDISRGMLQQARARGLHVVEGSVTDLPFPDASFDTVYSFKVLAHVAEIERAVAEIARVMRPGGRAALEFYNRISMRYLVKRLKPAHRVSQSTTDEEVYTRYDTLADVENVLPPSLKVTGMHGIRVFTPMAHVHRLPVLKQVFGAAERWARDNRMASKLGGFMVVMLEKTN